MKKYLSLKIALTILCFVSIHTAYGQACTPDAPNVEITIESVEILAGCDGDPVLDTSIEPSISIGGQVLAFSPSNSADGGALGASALPGVYTLTNADLVDGCSNSTIVGVGAATGTTVALPIEIWEEDGCGTCSYGTGTFCNDDADYQNLGTINVDITQATGSFTSGCYIFNYSVACPPPCDAANCSNDVSIMFTSVDASGCDGDAFGGDVEASISINGTVYEFEVDDSGNTTVSAANENCAGSSNLGLGVFPAGTTSIPISGIEVWEEDGCGNCSYGTGTFCNDDADYQSGISHTIDLAMAGGSISGGCFTFNYDLICTSLCCLTTATSGTALCDGDNAVFNVSFDTSDTPTTYDVIDNATNAVIGSGMTSPIQVTITGPTTAGTTVDIIVQAQGDASCATQVLQVTLPDCPEPDDTDCTIPSGTWSK